MNFGSGTTVPMGWSLATSIPDVVQPTGYTHGPLKSRSQTPKWYSEIYKAAQPQFMAENSPSNAAPTVAPQAQQLFKNMYGQYSGGPIQQSLQDTATRAYTARNPFPPAGLVGSAMQQYVQNGLNNGHTGSLAQFMAKRIG